MAEVPKTGSKQVVYAHFAEVARALGNGHRLELLELLAQSERSVEGLAELAGLAVANASQHLHHLRRLGLVSSRREGKYVFYRMMDDAVVRLMGALREVAERNYAEAARVVELYFRQRDALEPVSREELLRRKREGSVTVLDVRPAEEFAAGHIEGAINIPVKELERRLAEVGRGREIVAYCRGPYCVMAYEAVARLCERGFKVRRLADGYPEWRQAGLPVAKGLSEVIGRPAPLPKGKAATTK
ncbi:MAG TPA: metalloregulator ArsR/SmtB family transcription factor [Dongiaceae bacterium]|nr:metalloregulator ArsR/SmtB family transcription factor [Dongiaceae bacterium]